VGSARARENVADAAQFLSAGMLAFAGFLLANAKEFADAVGLLGVLVGA
jgi:hypothetical protein